MASAAKINRYRQSRQCRPGPRAVRRCLWRDTTSTVLVSDQKSKTRSHQTVRSKSTTKQQLISSILITSHWVIFSLLTATHAFPLLPALISFLFTSYTSFSFYIAKLYILSFVFITFISMLFFNTRMALKWSCSVQAMCRCAVTRSLTHSQRIVSYTPMLVLYWCDWVRCVGAVVTSHKWDSQTANWPFDVLLSRINAGQVGYTHATL